MAQTFENGFFQGRTEAELEAGRREFDRLEGKIDAVADEQKGQSKEIAKIRTALLVIVILTLVSLPENVVKLFLFLKGLLT